MQVRRFGRMRPGRALLRARRHFLLDILHRNESAPADGVLKVEWRKEWGARSLLSRFRQSHNAPREKLQERPQARGRSSVVHGPGSARWHAPSSLAVARS